MQVILCNIDEYGENIDEYEENIDEYGENIDKYGKYCVYELVGRSNFEIRGN